MSNWFPRLWKAGEAATHVHSAIGLASLVVAGFSATVAAMTWVLHTIDEKLPWHGLGVYVLLAIGIVLAVLFSLAIIALLSATAYAIYRRLRYPELFQRSESPPAAAGSETVHFEAVGIGFDYQKFADDMRAHIVRIDDTIAKTAGHFERQDAALHREIEAARSFIPPLQEDIAELGRRLEAVRLWVAPTEQGTGSAATEPNNILAEHNRRLTSIESSEARLSHSADRARQEIGALLGAMNQLIAVNLLFAAPEKPQLAGLADLTAENITEEKTKANTYFFEACNAIALTEWAEPIKMIKQWAEGDAEKLLRDTPQERLPAKIHALDLREYLICKATADRLDNHLWNQRQSEPLRKFRQARELIVSRLEIREREGQR